MLKLTALPGVEVLKTFGLNTDWCNVSISAVSNGLQQCTLFCNQQREPSVQSATENSRKQHILDRL